VRLPGAVILIGGTINGAWGKIPLLAVSRGLNTIALHCTACAVWQGSYRFFVTKFPDFYNHR